MQRIKSIDLARGFTVLFIPIVHSVMVYGTATVHSSSFGNVLAFIAEWPGAQVFMLLMGVSFALTKKKTFKQILLRSIVLLVLAYLLNVLKFVIPGLMDLIPKALLSDLNYNGWLSLLSLGDILHFVVLTLPILFVIRKLPEYQAIAIILAFIICFASPVIWNISSNTYLLQLVGGSPPKVFFPLFPWLVYPLTGLAAGYYIKRYIVSTHLVLLIFGITLYILATLIQEADECRSVSFYQTFPWDTMRHLGFVMLWVSVWYWIAECVPDNFFFRFLTWCSKRITLIYLIQWPIIFWLLPVFGYQQLSLWESVVIGIDVTIVVFAVTYFLTRKRFRVEPGTTANE